MKRQVKRRKIRQPASHTYQMHKYNSTLFAVKKNSFFWQGERKISSIPSEATIFAHLPGSKQIPQWEKKRFIFPFVYVLFLNKWTQIFYRNYIVIWSSYRLFRAFYLKQWSQIFFHSICCCPPKTSTWINFQLNTWIETCSVHPWITRRICQLFLYIFHKTSKIENFWWHFDAHCIKRVRYKIVKTLKIH